MIKLISLQKDFVIIYKPQGIPSQSDPSGDPDAMTLTAQTLRGMGERDRLWLIHRLDRTVGGLIVFARNQFSARELSRIVADGEMEKYYLAVTTGEPASGLYSDYLYKDARLSKSFVVEGTRRGVQLSELECSLLSSLDGRSLSSIKLLTGRFHQIRVQLSSRGTPIIGDGKYGSRDKGARMPALHAYRLCFEYKGELIEARCLPDLSSYPWSLFAEKIKSEVQIYD